MMDKTGAGVIKDLQSRFQLNGTHEMVLETTDSAQAGENGKNRIPYPGVSAPVNKSMVALIIDDELQMRRLLRLMLEAQGYQVYEAKTGQEGLIEAAQCRPEIILLDLGLPDMDGQTVLKRLREWSSVPVVVLSERDREEDKVAALDAGADDYVTKPFAANELLARLRVAQRHAQPATAEPVFRSGPLTVDLASRSVIVNGKLLKLTGTEYALLRVFVRNAGKVLTHPQIMEAVWGPGQREKTKYLYVYMTYLREKIEAVPAKPALLVTEAKVGYRLNVESPAHPGAERPPAKAAMTEAAGAAPPGKEK
jgi:two-component system KDP operon response regulator KdpE